MTPFPGEGQLYATLETTMGSMTVKLFETLVPKTVANFVGLATGEKPYIPKFMIQAGDPTATGTGGPGFRFEDEFHPTLRHNKPGILSMANAGPGTNGSQFFITEVPTPHLDNRHSVFGEVVEGLELIAQITGVPRDGRDRPRTDVTLKSVTIYRK